MVQLAVLLVDKFLYGLSFSADSCGLIRGGCCRWSPSTKFADATRHGFRHVVDRRQARCIVRRSRASILKGSCYANSCQHRKLCSLNIRANIRRCCAQNGEIVNDDLRTIDWVPDGDIKLRPRTYGREDAAAFTASHSLFACKFEQNVDGDILSILEVHLARQTHFTVAKFELATATAA